jgi:hypothetical protein
MQCVAQAERQHRPPIRLLTRHAGRHFVLHYRGATSVPTNRVAPLASSTMAKKNGRSAGTRGGAPPRTNPAVAAAGLGTLLVDLDKRGMTGLRDVHPLRLLECDPHQPV